MNQSEAPPLVSFLVFAYNHEKFVRDAVRSALSQTYEPLEVIISDDSSSDRTRRIIQEELDGYSGKHRITLNYSESNQGLATMVNRAFALAQGELFVMQGGDDISESLRTTRLVQAWRDAGKPDVVVSNVSVIDSQGECIKDAWHATPIQPTTLQDAIQRCSACLMGCAAAYKRTLFDQYGPLNRNVIQEDNVLLFRGLLGAGMLAIDDRLVRYRIHGANMYVGTEYQQTSRISRMKAHKWALNRLEIAKDWAHSLKASGIKNHDYERRLALHVLERQMDVMGYESSRLLAARVAVRARRAGLPLRKAAGILKRHLFRI